MPVVFERYVGSTNTVVACHGISAQSATGRSLSDHEDGPDCTRWQAAAVRAPSCPSSHALSVLLTRSPRSSVAFDGGASQSHALVEADPGS